MKDASQLPSAFRLKTGLRFGILISLINSLLEIALYYMGLIDYSGGSGGWITLLLTGLGIYLASEHYKKQNDGLMRHSDVVVTSLWMGLFSGIISLVFLQIQLTVDPSILEKMKDVLEFQLEKQDLDGEAYDKAMELGMMFMNPWVLSIGTLVSSVFSALIVGSILGFFLKREAETPF
jgi:hypothetical protein